MRCFAAITLCAALLSAGCGAKAPSNPQEVPIGAGDASALLWAPPGTPQNPPVLIVLTAPGMQPAYWAPLASLASRDGYSVVVCPSGDQEERLTAALQLATARALDMERCAVVAEGPAARVAMQAIASGAPIQAVAAFSVTMDDLTVGPEAAAQWMQQRPLLLVACENDIQAASAARALKDAAPGYCEIQTYGCSVRGADMLAAAPTLPGQVLAWLKPILLAK
jgi:hypothetical protein